MRLPLRGAEVLLALADSGASVNLLRRDVFNKVDPPRPLLPPPLDSPILKWGGGQIINYDGVVTLPVTLMQIEERLEHTLEATFFVVPTDALIYSIILGQPGMDQHLTAKPQFKSGLVPDSLSVVKLARGEAQVPLLLHK